MDVERLQKLIADFTAERDWSRFHTAKNLAVGASIEAAELVELFHWADDEEVARLTAEREFVTQVEEELADVQIYLLMLAGKLDIDIEAAVARKIEINARNYPAAKARGRSGRPSRD